MAVDLYKKRCFESPMKEQGHESSPWLERLLSEPAGALWITEAKGPVNFHCLPVPSALWQLSGHKRAG